MHVSLGQPADWLTVQNSRSVYRESFAVDLTLHFRKLNPLDHAMLDAEEKPKIVYTQSAHQTVRKSAVGTEIVMNSVMVVPSSPLKAH